MSETATPTELPNVTAWRKMPQPERVERALDFLQDALERRERPGMSPRVHRALLVLTETLAPE